MSRKYHRWLAVFVFALALALPFSLPLALDARGQSAEEITEQAIKLYEERNYRKAAPLFRKAAEQGYVGAQLILGSLYAEGKGVEQSYKQSAEWYRKAAKQGDADAQNHLGGLYVEGKGVLENYKKATEWFRKAAEQGHYAALYRLATMYAIGWGVKKDSPTAYALFLLSIKEGSEKARDRADKVRENLTTEQIMEGQEIAKEWEELIEANKQKNQ